MLPSNCKYLVKKGICLPKLEIVPVAMRRSMGVFSHAMNWITKLLDFLYSFFNKRTIVLENGKYSIGKIIGSGGYSMVYLAKPLNRLIKGSANDEELGLTSKKDYNLVCKMVSTVLDEQKKVSIFVI